MRRKLPNTYYAIGYEHIPYGHTESTTQYACYMTLQSAQETMMKMIKRGQVVIGMEEKKLVLSPEILTIHRKGTP